MRIIKKTSRGTLSVLNINAAAVCVILLCAASAILSDAGEKPDLPSSRPSAARAVRGREIVAYFPNWQWYERGFLVNPGTINYEKYTVINYAFFRPMADGGIGSTDTHADENLLLGPVRGRNNDAAGSLPSLARQSGVKVLASIGGWNDSYNFPLIAADADRRRIFAGSCVSLVEKYNLDGIDIDWEYPGYAPHGGTREDRANFTLLIREVRKALDGAGASAGRRYLLTACFGASRGRMEHIEWSAVIPMLDMVNLMTYDFHVPYGAESNHHSPLYGTRAGSPDWCAHGAFSKLTGEFGVPPEKINIGLAFYGHALAGCTALYGPHSGYDRLTFPEESGRPRYYNILKRKDLFNYHWDDGVKNPYLLGKEIDTFVTYDDPRSVGYKARYAADNNAMGVFIWDLTGDYVETYPGSGEIAGTPLLDSVIEAFRGGGSSCFIASAAYGSPSRTEVTLLREFRDGFLLACRAGRFFTRAYYSASPGAAEAAAGNRALGFIARLHLAPLVNALSMRETMRAEKCP